MIPNKNIKLDISTVICKVHIYLPIRFFDLRYTLRMYLRIKCTTVNILNQSVTNSIKYAVQFLSKMILLRYIWFDYLVHLYVQVFMQFWLSFSTYLGNHIYEDKFKLEKSLDTDEIVSKSLNPPIIIS